MRILKFLGIALGALLGLLVIGLLAIWLFVHPNDYKGRIATAVKQSTGRELELPGDIHLSVFPWLALELGPASLGNPAGFSQEPFATLRHAAVRVRLLPLLHGQLEAGRIEVDGLDLRLRRNAQGKGNWEDFGQADAAQPQAAHAAPTLPVLAGLVVRDSRMSFDDLVADQVQLEVGRVAPGAVVPVSLQLALTPHAGAQPMTLKAQLALEPDLDHSRYQVSGLALSGTLPGASPLAFSVAAPTLDLDLAAQTLAMPTLAAQLGDAQFTASAQGTRLLDAPAISGHFTLAPLALRAWLKQLGIEAPVTRDPKMLGQLAGSGDYAYGGNALRGTRLEWKLDDSTLRGSAAVTNLDTMALAFDLTLDRIDLDRYRAPEPPAAAAGAKGSSGAASPGTAAPAAAAPAADVPVAMLRGLAIDGTARIGQARVAGLTLTQALATIDAHAGLVRLAPLQAGFYGGHYAGSITLDARPELPTLALEQAMDGVDLAALLQDFAHTQRLSGRTTINAKLTAQGRRSDALLRSLSGHATAAVANGAIEGLDLWFAVQQAQSLAEKHTLAEGQGKGRTAFETLKASADIAGGVASTHDLAVTSQLLRVSGEGSANLVSEAIDYRVLARILKQAPGAGGASPAAGGTLVDVPLTIKGTMAEPVVRPDLEGLAKARLQQELDKHKDEIRDKVKGALEGLFKR